MNIRNTKRQMSGTNTYKEHLLYNEKKRNVKNIDIVFDPRQFFDTYKNFMDPCQPRHQRQILDPRHFLDQRQKFMSPRLPRKNLTNATNEPTHPRHQRTHASRATHAI